MGARLGTLRVPPVPLIERTNVRKHAVGRRVQMGSLLRDPFAQELQIFVHRN